VIRLLLAHTVRLRAIGLVLLAAGIALALAVDAVIGLAIVAAAAVLLAVSQLLVVQWARSRAGRRVAARNGHPGPALPEDVDRYPKR
jgi:hypothetical protein